MVDLKGMSKKKKAEYIWEYYKLHIIGVLVVISIIGSLVHSQITKVDYVFNLTMLGNTVNTDKVTDLQSKLTSLVVKDGDTKKEAIISNMSLGGSTSSDPTMESQYMQKFVAQLSVGELDVVILDKDMFESFAKQDMFLRLDNLSGFDLASIKSEKIEATATDKTKAVYAINAKDIKVFKDVGYDTTNKVIGIISTTKQKNNSVLVLKWLLNK
ncbi:hypothetical protein [Clostridium lacusfryxellense]|uniref:hypothetical protein n=1 Tax=Clostridium lacusfryxellense TaxID=205328 RepID=UPI001C0C46DB|nr:hypothetical protein [Clostridium lacusfryxellense]MBU3113979.1 hypothetical protein [Clostridium lacusfryxellense]